LLTKNLKIKIYRTIILPVALCGCETWSLTLREESRLRVTREWRKLHNEELNDLYSSPSIVWVIKIEKNEMGRACSAYGEEEGRI